MLMLFSHFGKLLFYLQALADLHRIFNFEFHSLFPPLDFKAEIGIINIDLG